LVGSPATIVEPDTATEVPRLSYMPPSEAVSFAVCVALAQPPAGSTNTYTAPCPVLAPSVAYGAPATIVPPETATE
jgi:hypothetical protein